ncbi:MAG: hypothetical protein ACNA8W_21240, partial [Bradymonadaceae bacterium]
FNTDRRVVRELSTQFLEDLQFKDFRSSSLYHHRLEQGRVDVGRSLERLFAIKPEMLDIIDYRVVKADVDSSENRARVLVNTRFRRLNMKDEPEEADVMLYWIKRHPECPIGATCIEGKCHNEYAEAIKRPDADKEDDRGKREKQLGDPEEVDLSDEFYTCDSMAEHKWFMNLDSTLKEKKYNL